MSDRALSGVLRRRWLGASVAGALALSGCGFQLRRAPRLGLQRVHLSGFQPRSPMADELLRQLRATPGLEITSSPTQAQVVLQAVLDVRERVAAASTATSLVSEITLRARLRFAVNTPQGQVLIPETELRLTQDMSFNESAAMAKEHEAELLYRAMQQDIAAQVLRRLAVLSLPDGGAALSAPAPWPLPAAASAP